MCSFMGVARYYQIFIEASSRLAYHITSLQKKGVKFESIGKCEENFDKMKQLLMTTPILKITDPSK